jgi:DNA-binding response OmpR family regulator
VFLVALGAFLATDTSVILPDKLRPRRQRGHPGCQVYRVHWEFAVSTVLLLTNTLQPSAEIVPALGLLAHSVKVAPAEATALLDVGPTDVVLVDARRELAAARSLTRVLRTTGITAPLLAVMTEGGLAGVGVEWGIDDVLVHTAGPAEVDARIRLAIGRVNERASEQDRTQVIKRGELVIDEDSYTAKLGGRTLDLTFKEFELVKFLAQHPGRVFTRQQLLQEVWGYDYFGGTRTVDVHVRRLRAKLGPEHESLIGTVRNVGYRFVPQQSGQQLPDDAEADRETRESRQAPVETEDVSPVERFV